jgi:hypothetical protein
MSPRTAFLPFALTVLAALGACRSSGRYGTPLHVAEGAALGVSGAVVSRAMGGCFATCLPGTVCNTANGLCERGEAKPIPAAPPLPSLAPAAAGAQAGPRRLGPRNDAPMPVPQADAGCDTSSEADGGALSCDGPDSSS